MICSGPATAVQRGILVYGYRGSIHSPDRASTVLIIHVRGVEKLPKSGPYILSSNHQSYLDPLILASVLPPAVFDRVFAVGTSEIFGEGFMLRLARSLRVVVVDPDANLIPAMRAGAFGLRQGRPLILYPEGERSIDGTPRTFKKKALPFCRFTCRRRLCLWQLKDFTKPGREINRFKDLCR